MFRIRREALEEFEWRENESRNGDSQNSMVNSASPGTSGGLMAPQQDDVIDLGQKIAERRTRRHHSKGTMGRLPEG
jgi:hypothetical protein